MKNHVSILAKTSFLFIVCLLVLITTSSNNQKATLERIVPEFKIILNNNPHFQGDSIHGKQVKNTPLILITGENITFKSQIELKILNNENQILFKNSFHPDIQFNKFSHQIFLNAPLKNPQTAAINYEGKTFFFPIKLHKIFGKVTDNKGNPLEVYFLVNWDSDAYIRAKSDKDGFYNLSLPEEKITHVFIDNSSYGKSTLECFWGHEFILLEDLKIDINIDRMELYNMRSWASFTSFNVYFIPMSLTRIKNQKLIEDEWPSLTNNRIKLYLNDNEISNKNLSIIKDILNFKTKSWRPAYIISFDINELLDAYKISKSVVIKVIAHDSLVINKQLFQDQGQAFLINPSYD